MNIRKIMKSRWLPVGGAAAAALAVGITAGSLVLARGPAAQAQAPAAIPGVLPVDFTRCR